MSFHEPRSQKSPSSGLMADNRRLLQHWEAMRGADAAAPRSRIKLEQIKDLLPQIAILEQMAERQSYRCRLAGTGITELWGMDMTGRDLREPAGKFEREVLTRLFDGALLRNQPFSARLLFIYAGDEELPGEILGLPVTRNDGSPQLLTCVLAGAARRSRPARPLQALQISATRLLDTSGAWSSAILKSHRLKIIHGGIDQ